MTVRWEMVQYRVFLTLALQTVLQFRMKDPLDHVGNASLGSHRLFLSLTAYFPFVSSFYHVRDYYLHGLNSPAKIRRTFAYCLMSTI
jgi:hypothetical protein